MTRLSLKIIAAMSLLFAFALPAQAQAHCSSVSGSYVVTCENGVKVYRHQTKSALPRSLSSQNQANPQQSAQAERRAAIAQQLEARRISIAERRQKAEATNLMRQRQAQSRRSYNRRYVSFAGRGFGGRNFQGRRFQGSRFQGKRVNAKH